jgi:hypothetical protein
MEVAILLLLAAVVYFLPALVACQREHHNAGAIFVLNLLLGWMLIPWVLALVWACTVVRLQQQQQPPPPPAQVPAPLPRADTHPTRAAGQEPARDSASMAARVALIAIAAGGVAWAILWRPATEQAKAPADQSHFALSTAEREPVVTKVQAPKPLPDGEAIKRAAERAHWCRNELQKPAAKRSERFGRLCKDTH